MVGDSAVMQEIQQYVGRVAASDCPVLITGETGTGKELVAELIHRHSARGRRPLLCLNCAALPDSLLESELFGYERGAFSGAEARNPGKLQLAEGGTVFFDEVGDMSPSAQAKVLRLLESKQAHRLGGSQAVRFDIRVLAATNQDLEEALARGHFRRDLYYRLNVARVHLPPLRQRPSDIQQLLGHYLEQMNRRYGLRVESFSPEALDCLQSYSWPGNVRELKNLLEVIFLDPPAGLIGLADLPEPFRRPPADSPTAAPNELDRLLTALLETNWNKSQAAHKLHWSRMTLYRKLARYHLTEGGQTPQATVTTQKKQ
jgi:two-component system response regulator HydG/two-component system response regulator AtoC